MASQKLSGSMIRLVRKGIPPEGPPLEPIFGVRSFHPGTRCRDVHGHLPDHTHNTCQVCHETGRDVQAAVDRVKLRPPTDPIDPDIRAQFPTAREQAMRNFAQDDKDHGRRPFTRDDRVEPDTACPLCGEVLVTCTHDGRTSMIELMEFVRQHPEFADAVDEAEAWDAHGCRPVAR